MPSPTQQALLMASAAGGGGGGGDPSWSNVVLLMGYEGANGSTGAPGMTDESSHAHGTATVNTGATISTVRSKFGSSSLSTTGASGCDITFAADPDWQFGSGNFTVELFVYFASAGTYSFVGVFGGTATEEWAISLVSQNIVFNWSGDGVTYNTLTGAITVTTGAWHHICVDFDGVKYRIYVDGVKDVSSTSLLTLYNSSGPLSIGAIGANNVNNFNGYTDELRITKGVARYATDTSFTVPAGPFPRHA